MAARGPRKGPLFVFRSVLPPIPIEAEMSAESERSRVGPKAHHVVTRSALDGSLGAATITGWEGESREAVHIRRLRWVRFLRVVTWRLCAGGQLVPVVHHVCRKSPKDRAFAVHMWARGYPWCCGCSVCSDASGVGVLRRVARLRTRSFFSGSFRPAERSSSAVHPAVIAAW